MKYNKFCMRKENNNSNIDRDGRGGRVAVHWCVSFNYTTFNFSLNHINVVVEDGLR